MSTDSAPTRITVRGDAPYDVVIGRGVRDRVPALLGDAVQRVALVHAPGLTADLPGHLADYQVLDLELPDGEAAKTAAVVADAWERRGEAGFTRSDAGHSDSGAARRTSMPSLQPAIISELPMLLRASPR